MQKFFLSACTIVPRGWAAFQNLGAISFHRALYSVQVQLCTLFSHQHYACKLRERDVDLQLRRRRCQPQQPALRFFRTYVGLVKHKFGATTSTYLPRPTYLPPAAASGVWPQKNLPTYLKVTAFTN